MRNKNMKLKLIILESKKGLRNQEIKHLQDVINRHARKAGKLLGVALLNITVHFGKDVISETGEAGYAKNDWIQITIDPTRKIKELQKIITDIIPATIYHETNHIAREERFGEGENLLEAIINEGLADVFSEEQWPVFKAPWSKYDKNKMRPFLQSLRKEKKNRKYLHSDWFFGTGNKPRWLGYKLGSYIVHSAKEKNQSLTALKMTRVTVSKIVKLSGVAI